MDFRKLTARYRQFGGIRLVREYWRMGALWPAVRAFFGCLVHGRSFKEIYPAVAKVVCPLLKEKYGNLIPELRARYMAQRNAESEVLRPVAGEFAPTAKSVVASNCGTSSNCGIVADCVTYSDCGTSASLGAVSDIGIAVAADKGKPKVWFCWMQGRGQMPAVVRVCLESLERELGEREIVVVDESNWRGLVQMPDYVDEKWRRGQIPAAMFTDLLRLELLIRYGGTWIDSTVLCTGQNFKAEYLDTDLFMFQYRAPGSNSFNGISNWFITARPGNVLLKVLRDMLYAYWKDYDCVVYYYIFHFFFMLMTPCFIDEVKAMPYGYSMDALELMHRWTESYEADEWAAMCRRSAFHKLSFRPGNAASKNSNSYYNYIANGLCLNKNNVQ